MFRFLSPIIYVDVNVHVQLTWLLWSIHCRAFAVVASALGIPSLLPFLKAVCRSKKSWQARHTGIKIVQQIAILMGCAILPHLRNLVEIIEHGKRGCTEDFKIESSKEWLTQYIALCSTKFLDSLISFNYLKLSYPHLLCSISNSFLLDSTNKIVKVSYIYQRDHI